MKKLFLLFLLFMACTPAPCQIDTSEFLPGHPSLANAPTAIEQLNNFPAPRYKSGHTLKPHFNNCDIIYFSGYQMPGIPDEVVRENSKPLQLSLAGKYNYMISLFWGGGAFNDTSVAIANRNPQFKVSIMTLRSQIQSWMDKQDFPNANYLQNASGQFLNKDGGITSAPYKIWRPTAPIADYNRDGQVVRGFLSDALKNLTDTVNFVSENDEVYQIYSPSALRADPVVNAAINSTPIPNPDNDPIQIPGLWLGTRLTAIDSAYRVQFMSLPQFKGAIYSEYRLGGNKAFDYNWNTVRNIQSTVNGQKYPSMDFYVRFPNNWATWQSAWHGLSYISHGRYEELKMGDKLTSYWIGAGWSWNLATNVLSAQWLGLLKVHGVWGGEYFQVGYFNENSSWEPGANHPNDPKGYAYQLAIPSYAQAITSRYEDILRNGTLLEGDMPDNTYAMKNPIPSYRFNGGASNKVIAIRKKGEVYVITGTIQNSDNIKGSTPLNSTATFTLNGNQYTINIRRQGSTYILDLTDPSDPVFYQLDGWHEASHPYRWSKDINLEAELFETSTGKIRTYPTNYPNLTSFQSFVMLSANQTATYNIETVNSGTKYLFIKGLCTGPVEAIFDGNMQVLNNLNGWNRISLSAVPIGPHSILLKSLGNSEIDSITISADINRHPISQTQPCVYVYSNWSACNNGTQTRTIISAEPVGCTGTPITSQSCTTPSCVAPTGILLTANRKNVLVGWDDVEISEGFTVDIWSLNGLYKLENSTLNPDYNGGTYCGLRANTDYKITIGTICPDNSVVKSPEISFKTTR